jgi:hypothetical protein
LHEQVLAFVEGALAQTNPGKAFAIGVLAALPMLTVTAKAATATAAAKGSASAKAAGALGLIAAIFGPLLIVFGNYLGYRIGLAKARSQEERGQVKSFYRKILLWTFGLFAVFAAVMVWLRPHEFSLPALFTCLFTGFVIIYLLTTLAFIFTSVSQRRHHFQNVLAANHSGIFPECAYEYRSRASFLGLPLVHIRIGDRFNMLRGPVKAWIAMGNFAVGGLIAFGGIAIAPVGIGFCGIGLLSYAGIALGLFPIGGIALGICAFGGLAVGWQSLGCFAIAWHAAMGYLAVAHDFALGHIVRATEANTDFASQIMQPNWFFKIGQALGRYSLWMNFIWITPLFIQWRLITRRQFEKTNF